MARAAGVACHASLNLLAKNRGKDDIVRKDFDYLFDKYVGPMGKWQITQLFCVMMSGIAMELPFLLHLFTCYRQKYRCFVPGCDTNYTLFHANFTSDLVPPYQAGDDKKLLMENDQKFISRCYNYERLDDINMTDSYFNPEHSCAKAVVDKNATVRCNHYVFDQSIFEETVFSEFKLVCQDEITSKINIFNSVEILGLMAGAYVGVTLCDFFGRKNTGAVMLLLIGPAVINGGLVDNVYSYAVLRFITVFCIQTGWLACAALEVESIGSQYRRKVFVLAEIKQILFTLILPMVINYQRHWRKMHLYVGSLALLGIPFMEFAAESIKWLTTKGHTRRAESLLKEAASQNGRPIPKEEVEHIRVILLNLAEEGKKRKRFRFLCCELFQHHLWQATLIMMFAWGCVALPFFLLKYNVQYVKITGSLLGDFCLAVCVELPAAFLLLYIDVIGRRFMTSFFLVTTGGALIGLSFIDSEDHNIIYGCVYLTAKGLASMVESLLWMYTAELYPTYLRSQAVGMCSLFRFGIALSGPIVLKWVQRLTRTENITLPTIIMGAPTIIAGILILRLRETKGKRIDEKRLQQWHKAHEEYMKELEDAKVRREGGSASPKNEDPKQRRKSVENMEGIEDTFEQSMSPESSLTIKNEDVLDRSTEPSMTSEEVGDKEVVDQSISNEASTSIGKLEDEASIKVDKVEEEALVEKSKSPTSINDKVKDEASTKVDKVEEQVEKSKSSEASTTIDKVKDEKKFENQSEVNDVTILGEKKSKATEKEDRKLL